MRSILAYGLLSLLLTVSTSYLFAQSPSNVGAADPAIPLTTSDLIAWSLMQNPEQVPPAGPALAPGPEPQPDTRPQHSPTQAQPQTRPQTTAGTPPAAEPGSQVFTGMVGKDAGSYVLKVTQGSSYKLDDQDKARQYDGQRVRVTGVLNSEINLIRVEKIEPLS